MQQNPPTPLSQDPPRGCFAGRGGYGPGLLDSNIRVVLYTSIPSKADFSSLPEPPTRADYVRSRKKSLGYARSCSARVQNNLEKGEMK